MLMLHKNNIAVFFSIFLVSFTSLAQADWFTSDETKELITKADAGDVEAQFRVGVIYDTGNGAPSSGEKAKKYYLMAANQGNAEAQNSLGSIYQAEKNYDEAKLWYEQASEQNHPTATSSLGFLYDLGLGVPQDRKKGFELYSKAANLGHGRAMWNIANMYGAGQLGEVDLLSTCIWVIRAQIYSDGLDSKLIQHMDRVLPALEKDLSSSDWKKCNEEANNWAPTNA
jgi:uncharacterized protein